MNINPDTEQIAVSANPAEDLSREPEKTEKTRRQKRRARALRSFLIRTAALALIIYVLFFHIVGIVFMPNRDMYPRLDAGDLLLYYRLEKNPKSQDIVVISKTVDGGEAGCFVCRIAAVPGDTVEVSAEKGLCVNGNTLIETGIFYPTEEYEDRMEYPVKLADGEYFVMADRRNGGMDSRYFGVVKTEEIRGVVITILRRSNL